MTIDLHWLFPILGVWLLCSGVWQAVDDWRANRNRLAWPVVAVAVGGLLIVLVLLSGDGPAAGPMLMQLGAGE